MFLLALRASSAALSSDPPARDGADSAPSSRCARAAPKSRQIARNLDWPLRRRQKLESERNSPLGDRRMCIEPVKFLHARAEKRAAFSCIIERNARAGRRLEMGRRLRLEPPLQVVRQKSFQRRFEVGGSDLAEPCLAG